MVSSRASSFRVAIPFLSIDSLVPYHLKPDRQSLHDIGQSLKRELRDGAQSQLLIVFGSQSLRAKASGGGMGREWKGRGEGT